MGLAPATLPAAFSAATAMLAATRHQFRRSAEVGYYCKALTCHFNVAQLGPELMILLSQGLQDTLS